MAPRPARQSAPLSLVVALAFGTAACAKVLGFDTSLAVADGGVGEPCAANEDCASKACIDRRCGSVGLGSGSSSGSGGPADSFDGTTGHPCTSDADCRGPSGPGNDTCDFSSPTPVCRLPHCIAPANGIVHYCDGPDAPGSPGICLADGTCWPTCTFQGDGTPASGCATNNACNAQSFGLDPKTGLPAGIGFCRGGCETDADCSNGLRCQVDQGLCVAALASHAALGTACDATASTACDCFYVSASHVGYCAQACKVGGAPCPGGSTCDALLPTTWSSPPADGSTTEFTLQNPGLGGLCAPTCVPGSATCPPNSTCQSITVPGPDCLP
jgi:hypothetical protein